jgi:hypothetical protein
MMAAGGERKALGNGSRDYNKDYQETVHGGAVFSFCIQIYYNYGYIGMGESGTQPAEDWCCKRDWTGPSLCDD